jgi:hypothetical protein
MTFNQRKISYQLRFPGVAAVLLLVLSGLAFSPALMADPPADHPLLSSGHGEVVVTFNQPLNGRERGQLTREGVRFVQSFGGSQYLVKVRGQGMSALENHARFVSADSYEAVDKLSSVLAQGAPGAHAINEDGSINIVVQFYPDVSLGTAISTLRKAGINPGHPQRLLFNARLETSASWEQITEISQSIQVRAISAAQPPKIDMNVNSAQVSNVDLVQAAPYGLDGDGVIFGMWESGNPEPTHDMLTGRITSVQGSTTDHGTHVGGTILGDGTSDATALGMSPSGDMIFSYTSGGDTADEQTDAVNDNDIVISNHSWGSALGWTFSGGSWSDNGNDSDFGNYDARARDWDAMVRSTGLIVDKAAGNDGSDCDPADSTDCDGFFGSDGLSYDTVGTHGNAKNIITVGAINDDGTTVTGFSSIGPSNDNRFKPDLVANGASLNSSCMGNTFCSKSGTSMSTPSVTGAAGLLIQRYRDPANFGTTPGPDVMKALWVNTAGDIGRPGPDYVFGFGVINTQLAVDTIDSGQVRILTDSVDQDETNDYLVAVPAGVVQLKASLNWLDPEAAQDDNPTLINDLDLLMTDPAFNTTFPFSGPGMGNVTGNATAAGANTVDTVEHAEANNPAQGFWTVSVSGTSVPEGPQSFALVVNGYDSDGQLVAPLGFVLDSEPDIRVNAALDFNVVCPPGNEERVVTIFNIGGADLLVNSVVVANTIGAAFSLGSEPIQPFIVQAGSHVDVTVGFAPVEDGDFEGTLTINSNDADQGVFVLEMTGTGGASEITTTFDDHFGSTCLGDTVTHDLMIQNSGSCPLSVDAIAIDNNSEFRLADTMEFPLVVAPGGEVTVPVEFIPFNTVGAHSAEMTITSDDPVTSAKVIDMVGYTEAADIASFIADEGFFGEVCAGDLKDLDLTVQNNGNCPLQIDDVNVIIGSNSLGGDWEIPSGDVNGTIVESGGSVQIPVRFSPAEFDEVPPLLRLATISIESRTKYEDSSDPNEIRGVSGQVPPPDINLAIANDGNFGNVCKGGLSDLDLTLFNQGKCDLTISNIELIPPGGSFILPSDIDLPLILSPDADFNYPVRYAPVNCSDVPEIAQIKVTSDDPDEMMEFVDISGTSPCPNLVIDPTGLYGDFAFPATVTDLDGSLGCYSERTAVVRNNGLCPLTIESITASAVGEFTVQSPSVFPVYLPTGEETLDVIVRFTPQSLGNPLAPDEFNGTLTIVSDDPDGNAEAGLCGEGVAQSGVRVLTTEISSGFPLVVEGVDSIRIRSKGKRTPSPIDLTFTDVDSTTVDICGNTVTYHVDQETLPVVGTAGSNPKSSYEVSAKEGSLQDAQSFDLNQCEFREFQLQLLDSGSDICLLKDKGESCDTDGECCSGNCKGKSGSKTCK